MDRLLVTHDWMGERFEQLLDAAPANLRAMFASTTAILIGSNVRPSFYTTLTGAIQIDPVYLWLTVPEKRTISVKEDFRTDFGSEIKFDFYRRLAIGNKRMAEYFNLEDDSERELGDIYLSLYRLLYHELTHANDFVPWYEIDDVDNTKSIYQAIQSIESEWVSPQFVAQYPLVGEELKNLANVKFRDAEPTVVEKTILADYAGSLMGDDGAMIFYSYSSIREDLATLVASSMLKFHYNVTTNIAYLNLPNDPENFSCDELIVDWGVVNRVAGHRVVPRAKEAVRRIVGFSDLLEEFFESGIGQETSMRIGESWCDNYQVDPVMAADILRARVNETMAKQLRAEQKEHWMP